MPLFKRKRTSLSILLFIVIIAGLGSRSFGSELPDFVAANAGDTLWSIAVYLCLGIISPTTPAWKLGLASLAISFAVEFSQLIDHRWLNAVRDTLPGKLLLGRGFLPVDLIRYFVGAAFAYTMDLLFIRFQSTQSGSRE
ncbi:DUF2809 domain-containing protein [Haloferula sp.]|uniref:ribosomal maturation YjgA family protein n=1 Tax=Haloferula sp. TaxID=2497595 RepID=UPI0032A0F29C